MTAATQVWINGKPADAISSRDRGLQFGDGLFETIAVVDGQALSLDLHLARLKSGCERLGINQIDLSLLNKEIQEKIAGIERGIAKLIVTRGLNNRGYRIDPYAKSNRILCLHDWPEYPLAGYRQGIALQLSPIRLARQPALAGIKHLNRLEQVLASQALEEQPEQGGQDALMLDSEGLIIETTKANLFWRSGDQIFTSSLDNAGVAGIARQRILDLLEIDKPAALPGLTACQSGDWSLAALRSADEVLTCNAIAGILPVREVTGIDGLQDGASALFAAPGKLSIWLQKTLFPHLPSLQ